MRQPLLVVALLSLATGCIGGDAASCTATATGSLAILSADNATLREGFEAAGWSVTFSSFGGNDAFSAQRRVGAALLTADADLAPLRDATPRVQVDLAASAQGTREAAGALDLDGALDALVASLQAKGARVDAPTAGQPQVRC